MNTIDTRFAGFSMQLRQPISAAHTTQITESLRAEVSERLGIFPQSVKISFPELSFSAPASRSHPSTDTTDLVEVEIDSRSGASIAQAWSWKYRLDALPRVRYVEPKIALLDPTRLKGAPPTNIPFPEVTENLEWHLEKTFVKDAWQHFSATKPPGTGVKIALPDTGYLFHPTLYNVLFKGPSLGDLPKIAHDFVDPDNLFPGKGFTRGRQPDITRFGHGVSTAALIFAPVTQDRSVLKHTNHTWDNKHIPGIAPHAEPLFLRVARSDYRVNALEFFAPPLGAAIHYAIQQGVHIIAISMGGYPTLAMRRAIIKAQSQGILVIASAGNGVPFTVWPGAYNDVTAVASSTAEGKLAKHSAKGTRITIAAPGEYVWCAISKTFYEHSSARRSGTSFATPIVAGIAALWLSHHGVDQICQRYPDRPEAIPIAFNYLLRETCDRWQEVRCGPGIINAKALLEADLPELATLEAAGLLAPQRETYASLERKEYLDLDEGGIRSFIHLFEQALPHQGGGDNEHMMQLMLSELLHQPFDGLERFLQTFGHELLFHVGVNQSLYRTVLQALTALTIAEVPLPAQATTLDELSLANVSEVRQRLAEVRSQLREVASRDLSQRLASPLVQAV